MKYIPSVAIVLSAFCTTTIYAQKKTPDSVYTNFISPPNSAKPRVWWHWMDGNISKYGIDKDLHWMKRTGIGGFQNFDANLTTPKRVKDRLVFMQPGWIDAFSYATRLADSLHLEMAIASSAGWSESGGPWVAPQDGMKKLVWSEVYIEGGKPIAMSLPKPPGVTGPYQNIPYVRNTFVETGTGRPTPQYAHNIATIAYKLPNGDIPISVLKPVVNSSGGNFSLAQLTDGDLATTSAFTADTGYQWIQFAFDKPCTINAITIAATGGERRALEKSDDGINFQPVAEVSSRSAHQTQNTPPATAKYFRITFKSQDLPAPIAVAELVLHTTLRISRLEDKAAFTVGERLYSSPTPTTAPAINLTDVIDLTNKVDAQGNLNWVAPAGNWEIVSFGYSLIGKTNHPASSEGTGLEVDKLDPVAISQYFHNYLDKYKNATGGLMGAKGGLQYIVTDSWEAGAQNWTPNMMQEFQKRRGYSMLPWMPVFTGHVVKSAEASDAFLWDFRKTLGEMLVAYHYDQLTDILKEYGLKRYSESHEWFRALIADGMDVKRRSAIPMGAMWYSTSYPFGGVYCSRMDIRESASVAHIYGQNLVAAESMTVGGGRDNGFNCDPQKIKPTADLELASGLNRFVIHTSVHQPTDDKPGFTLGGFGQWFTRQETWAEQAKAWTTYLARSAYLLQQGKFVADFVYYYGEDSNITSLFGNQLPDIPAGYNYDFINPYALINLLTVKNGKLVTPSGMSYKLLVLDDNARAMSLPVLRKLRDLVKDGATISGIIPEKTPSLADDTIEFKSIVNEIWHSGKPRVFANKPLSKVLPEIGVAPDFDYTKPTATTTVLYVHRKLTDRDIYWLNNREDSVRNIAATFRITGKAPEVWHPETGKTEAVSYSIANGITKVNLHLEPSDAIFVIFKKTAVNAVVKLPAKTEKPLITLSGPWVVNFQKDRGAPNSIQVNDLKSWSENPDSGVKYFSGTAAYIKTINAAASWSRKGAAVWLDMGDVKNLAEVIVNGKSVGIIWKKPYRADISHALKPGKNTLQIKVTNAWVNRIIGDLQPNAKIKYTWSTSDFYDAKSPLMPSGLLGPVKILSVSK